MSALVRSTVRSACRRHACLWKQTSSLAAFSSTPARAAPIVELREYALSPEYAATYMEATADSIELRKSLAPLRFFSLPETGGQLHNRVEFPTKS